MNGTVVWGALQSAGLSVYLLYVGAKDGDAMGLCVLMALCIWVQWGFFSLARYHREQAHIWHIMEIRARIAWHIAHEAHVAELGRQPASWSAR